jgi:hypothetical protein
MRLERARFHAIVVFDLAPKKRRPFFFVYGGCMRLMLIGILLLGLSAAGFFVLLMRGSESVLIYPLAALMYVGLGIALYAAWTFWTHED